MPKGATIINAGRGGHINERHLLKMIELGHIKNAYLDVFENEPLPIDHPFWNHNKIIIWPHVAGQTNISTTITSSACRVSMTQELKKPIRPSFF